MKQETNNEMDLLLRRLGRRDDTTVSNADHLDTDELSAYAENALPAAARARYTVHLAECSRCRGLVVHLSSSAGVVAATESAAVTEPSAFKRFLASLFTPMVLRYAAPALGLIVVAAIGFVVLRREQRNEFVAQTPSTAAPAVASPSVQPAQGFHDSALKDTPDENGSVDKQAKNQTAQPAPPPPNAPPVVTSVETDLSKDKAAAKPKQDEQTASPTEAPAPRSEPTATPEQSPRAADAEVSKKEVREQPAAAREKTLQAEERKDSDNFARARKPANTANAPAASVSSAGTGSVARIQRDGVDESSAVTRTVAGRRFRKQGNVWVDTAYDSSKDTVKLARGSEQYRALVADEPAIKTIADTLDGEVIVVWKGRPYRIR
jgi:outer membrane biosynthesis protein TonB